jgi:hypothetical protein
MDDETNEGRDQRYAEWESDVLGDELRYDGPIEEES